jgi:UDP-3-O-[3-hydroxymyristoyl] N-acetylglucosamine deacetylase/3-hydroxyacyl-[acyl-carrier-protein] dehydratase
VSGRRTVAQRITLEGVGLHLGEPVRLTFAPAEPGSGVRFRRVDLPETPEIPVRVEHAVQVERRTQLGSGATACHTIEHVLAAVVGQEIDDLLIELDASEPPIMDGSAQPFVEALERAGIVERGGTVEYLELRTPVRVVDGDATYEARPAPSLSLDITIDFPHPLIGRQTGRYEVSRSTFVRDLAGARTFGFMHEVESLRTMGLIRGATTANAVVLDDEGVIDTTLRWPDEFLRHKALDFVGDLALAGRRVRAHVMAIKPSHRGTVALVREMTTSAARETRMFDINDIMRVLPHRYPFLFVDRVLEMEERKRIVAIKNVTINEPFFQGHFPGHPIMPGVLIIEAMAQVGGILLMGLVDDPETKVVYFISLDNVRFRRPVRPGDQLRFECEVTQLRGATCKMHGIARVDGDIAAEADMGAMVRNK